MMFGVSEPSRDDHAYRHDPQPTMPLPQVGPGRRRHAAQQSTPWLWWLIGAGAIVTVLLGLLAAFFIAGGGPDRPATEPAPAQSTTVPDESPSVAAEEPSPSASPSPSPQRTTPAAVLARLKSTVTSLGSTGQLDQDVADELSGRLDEARKALAEGDVDKARDELSDFAKKVLRLHKDDELSDSGYQTLASLMTQLAQVLPKP
jgi:hypothetical protein